MVDEDSPAKSIKKVGEVSKAMSNLEESITSLEEVVGEIIDLVQPISRSATAAKTAEEAKTGEGRIQMVDRINKSMGRVETLKVRLAEQIELMEL